ncbi:MAG: tripartite tricarboxylate transporter substrate binding protein [Syntrophales bacterium LBB04]|nr:tripartite tricarboxylate transporter substrate binding protein [Syntrophales bacterium LBB04]
MVKCLTPIATCMLLLIVAGSLWGQPAYPTKPIDLLIGYAPGGIVDVSERFLAGKAEKYVGQPMVITNNGGGGSSVAVAIIATKQPDGYNLSGCASTGLIRIPQFRTVPYKWDDLVPIMHFATPILTSLVVRSDSSFKSVKDLVSYARKNPGKLTYSTTGVGSPMHMAMEYIAKQEGVKWTHVPYPGTMPAFMALLGGHVVAQAGAAECVPYIKEGKVRLLATISEKRVKTFPDVPTLRELGYDTFNETVFMFAAPKGTPQYIIDKLDNAFHKSMADPEFNGLMGKLEMEPSYRNSADTRKYLEEAYVRIGKLIRDLQIPREDEKK